MFPGSGIRVGCAVHHTDGEGNTIPCPGYPHAEAPGAANACVHSEAYEGECPCVSGCGCCKVAPAHPPADEGHPEPPSDEELNSVLPVRLDPRQPAYDAVYEYIRRLGPYLPPDPRHRNAVIWRAVHAALEATPVGRCISSHCVEGGHILPVEQEA
jgi:hypothetical protein